MHLVPPERAGQPAIDEHRACEAIEALGDPGHVAAWAERFALVSDPNRLAILLSVDRAGPISVTDLALATGLTATSVSQVLRLLRASGAVTGTRDGRVIRYRLTDRTLGPILAMARATHTAARADHR
ncbi:ArsR/SmtB family transcription factor [Nocardia sp. NPDC020380]|uniref:ArsR/SmtB family transcription factor n=1 Tax=Nocardia sp. NPDC020380 TaxID=3364309 RepID=UPI003791672F